MRTRMTAMPHLQCLHDGFMFGLHLRQSIVAAVLHLCQLR